MTQRLVADRSSAEEGSVRCTSQCSDAVPSAALGSLAQRELLRHAGKCEL